MQYLAGTYFLFYRSNSKCLMALLSLSTSQCCTLSCPIKYAINNGITSRIPVFTLPFKSQFSSTSTASLASPLVMFSSPPLSLRPFKQPFLVPISLPFFLIHHIFRLFLTELAGDVFPLPVPDCLLL
jgi:hypothetical protein